jgi:hypothetical protein
MTFNRKGGALVCASAATGLMQPVTASTQIVIGWAEVPRSAVPGTNDYWTSSSTAGKDRVLVIHDPTAIFAMPADETLASLTASLVGAFCTASAPAGRESTGLMQWAVAKPSTTQATAQLFCTGVDVVGKVVYVRVNPGHSA